MIDEPALRAYLAQLGEEISRGLHFEEVQLTLERVDDPSSLEHEATAVDWIAVVEQDGTPSLAQAGGAACAFGLTRDELQLIDAGLSDVVGEGFRAFIQRSGRRPAIWKAFVLDGSRGRFRLTLWRSD